MPTHLYRSHLLVPVAILILQRGSKVLERPFTGNDIKYQLVIGCHLWTLIVEVCNLVSVSHCQSLLESPTNRSYCASDLVLANLWILSLPHGKKSVELRMDQKKDRVSGSGKRVVVLTSNNKMASGMHLGLLQDRLGGVKTINALLQAVYIGSSEGVFHERGTDLRSPL